MPSILKMAQPVVVKARKEEPAAKKGALAGVPNVEQLLDLIVPPQTRTTEDGSLWVQRISSTPATRTDTVHVQESLDQQLQARQARETGICPIRESLYNEAMDELIRQVSISCAERGVLMLRVRDEGRMVLSSYQSLYESSIAFGMRKALMAEQHKAEMEAKIKLLGAEVADLERTQEQLTARIAEVEAAEKVRSEEEEAKHALEVEKLQASIGTLRDELESLLAPPRK